MNLPRQLIPGQAPTALAPMQNVTGLPFMRLIGRYGAPDYFFTEFMRIHSTSRPEADIVECVLKHDTGRPVFIQFIGESVDDMQRTIRLVEHLPIAGVDINLGCPAPKVYRKNVGGGLLREPEKVAEIFRVLRAETPGLFTVKMRTGFDDTNNFHRILDLVNDHHAGCLSIHGRTVKQLYRGAVNYALIRDAVDRVDCPVFANGNISSAEKAADVLAFTGACGAMVGRSAIRNPWIFRQIREHQAGKAVFRPCLRDVRAYVEDIYHIHASGTASESGHLGRVKKFANFVGQGVDPEGNFLHDMRRARSEAEFFSVCDRHLIADGRGELPFASEPYDGVIARPNCEDAPREQTCQL